jgi:hypothetical protein
MRTHELASNLRKLARYLEERPEFDANYIFTNDLGHNMQFYEKELYVTAAKSLGSATKKYTSTDDLEISPKAFPSLKLSIPRDKVCKKTVVYDCEALFSADEVEEL